MNALHFKSVIQIIGVNPYVHVWKEQARELKPDWKRPMPVRVQINGKPEEPWHINMMPNGDGSFYLYLHGDVRKESNTKVGDEVTVEVQFDEEYHSGSGEMPEWFKKALDKNPTAKDNWGKLIPSRQKEFVRYLAHLKTPEAIERNLAKAISVLSGSEFSFLGRDWKGGN